MKWTVHVPGKPARSFYEEGFDFYLRRISPHTGIEVKQHKTGKKLEESVLNASKGQFRLLLDEKGKSWSSIDFARWIEEGEINGFKGRNAVSVICGAAEGASKELKEQADLSLCLSPFTLQHDLALLTFMEQLYRGYCIKTGHPYHRD